MRIEWAKIKAVLLFFGLLVKGLAFAEPLPFEFGPAIKAGASILWVAIDGAFFWLLKPPSEREEIQISSIGTLRTSSFNPNEDA